MKKILSRTSIGDMTAVYYLSEEDSVEFVLIPQEDNSQPPQGAVDSLVQLKAEGDAFPYGFANGCTMRNCETVLRLRYHTQEIEEKNGKFVIHTILSDDRGLRAEHVLTFEQGDNAIGLRNIITNCGKEEIVLEMVSSFSLAGLKGAESEESDLFLHRIRSKWSAEGMPERRSIEELQLEPSWSRWGIKSEKYAQAGSMPVRGYYPFGAVEDRKRGLIWAAQLAVPASWQIEVYRRDENLCLSGGIADYDTGHWCKTLKPGESFVTPEAFVTVTHGGFDDACQRLVRMQKKKIRTGHDKLPVLFNEFCTTWGCPKEENIERILDVINDWGIDCFVIDAGWYADERKGWESNMGDWEVSEALFPHGLGSVVDRIHAAGMKAGIWFEPEVTGQDAIAFHMENHLLKRRGKVITSGARRFWDMRQEWVRNYLRVKVMGFLKEYGFDYIKADYNESIGIGCDGEESLGEGLRCNMEAAAGFYEEIRREIPNIQIEICASGGHRQEPFMIGISDYVSFSDAHEEKEIPVIAANLHRVMLPEKSQIWAVLRKEDPPERIVYSMTAAMLGVMCLSGDVLDFEEEQRKIVMEGVQFYRKISYIIKDGITRYFGTEQDSYRHLRGWQAVVRYGRSGDVLVIIHTFEEEYRRRMEVSLGGKYMITDIYPDRMGEIKCTKDGILLSIEEAFVSVAIYLKREKMQE